MFSLVEVCARQNAVSNSLCPHSQMKCFITKQVYQHEHDELKGY